MLRILLAFLLLSSTALAQQPEQVAAQINLNPVSCTGQTDINGGTNQIIPIENFVASRLPPTIYITRAFLWADGTDPLDATTHGNITFAIDPGRKYIAESGFPATQFINPSRFKTLGALELFPNGSRQRDVTFNPPISYHPTVDAMISAAECGGNGGPLRQIFVTLFWQALADIPDPAPADVIFTGALDTPSISNPGFSFRNIIPVVNATRKIRARVFAYKPLGTNIENITHLSACVQASGSTCAAAPVELTFGSVSGISLLQQKWAWSDCVPLAAPAGANLLITASLFNAGNTNAWGLQANGGLGGWASSVDSWNTITMQGAPVYQPTHTQVIDRAQECG